MNGSARGAACLPFGMVGELRRQLGPVALAVLLLFMGVGIMDIRVSAEFPCLRQRAAFCHGRHGWPAGMAAKAKADPALASRFAHGASDVHR